MGAEDGQWGGRGQQLRLMGDHRPMGAKMNFDNPLSYISHSLFFLLEIGKDRHTAEKLINQFLTLFDW